MISVDEVLKTGIWWSDPWWEDPMYLEDIMLSLDGVLARINVLKRYFNAEWLQRAHTAGPPNSVIPILIGGKGIWPFQNLMWLGSILHSLVDVSTVNRPLENLIGTRTRSSLFELEAASWFANSGWTVEFPKTRNDKKTPDIIIQRSGIESAIECKKIEPEQWEEWVERLHFAVLRRLDDPAVPQDVSFDVILQPRLSDVNPKDTSFQSAIIEEISDDIARALVAARPTKEPRGNKLIIFSCVLEELRSSIRHGIDLA